MIICSYLQAPIFIIAILILYQTFIYLPLWIECWDIRLKMTLRWYILTLNWWLILKAAIWNEPPLKPGKKINSTYWMHVAANRYSIKDQIRELTRKRSWLDKKPHLTNAYHDVLSMICLCLVFNNLLHGLNLSIKTWVAEGESWSIEETMVQEERETFSCPCISPQYLLTTAGSSCVFWCGFFHSHVRQQCKCPYM